MGVIYKLTEEVVQFILQQRTANAGLSCRELAQGVKERFQINVSKSSIHDVLKEANIVTPRGRKPKFKIPLAKKEQIKAEVTKSYPVEAVLPPVTPFQGSFPNTHTPKTQESTLLLGSSVFDPEIKLRADPVIAFSKEPAEPQGPKPGGAFAKALKQAEELTGARPAIYEGAAKIFLKAAWWDLGIFDGRTQINEQDREYYLTYARGIKVWLQDGQSYFAEFAVPLQRCIIETMDGLISNIVPWVVSKVSDESLLEASMANKNKIRNIQIVDYMDHIISDYDLIRELKRNYSVNNVIFVENKSADSLERCKTMFFSQNIEIKEDMFICPGFDYKGKGEYVVTLCCDYDYAYTSLLSQAAESLNQMFLRNEQGLLVRVKIISENAGQQ